MVTNTPKSTSPPSRAAHDASVRLSITEVVARLTETLGTTLVAYVAGSRSRQMPHRWASGDAVPRDDAQVKLMAAYRALTMIESSDSADIARRWFIGMNPRLSDVSPAERLRGGDVAKVLAAAEAFADGTDG